MLGGWMERRQGSTPTIEIFLAYLMCPEPGMWDPEPGRWDLEGETWILEPATWDYYLLDTWDLGALCGSLRWENAWNLGDGSWELVESLMFLWEYSKQASLSIQSKYDCCVWTFWGFWTLCWEKWNCGNHSPINSRQHKTSDETYLGHFQSFKYGRTTIGDEGQIVFPHCWYVSLFQGSVTGCWWIPQQAHLGVEAFNTLNTLQPLIPLELF